MARVSPWARIHKGIQYKPEAYYSLGVDDVLEYSGLDWNVELRPVFTHGGEYDRIEIPDRFATVRVDNDTPLAIVGSVYKPSQNREFITLLNELRIREIAEFESVSYMKSGQMIYAIMKLNDDVVMDADPHAGYLIARTSHDGSCSLEIAPLMMRLLCTNAINSTILKARNKGTVVSKRHTKYADFSDLSLSFQVSESVDAIKNYTILADKYLQIPTSDAMFEYYLDTLLPVPTYPGAYDDWSIGEKRNYNRTNRLRVAALSAWTGDSKTQDNIKNTAYGAFQAFVEASDHSKDMSEAQAKNILFGDDSTLKSKAFDLILN